MLRETFAQRAVTVLRFALAIPGRLGRAAVTVLAWWGAWEIGAVSIKAQPTADFKLLLVALAVFGFGTLFAFPERAVRTFGLLANAADAVRGRKPSP